MTAKSASSSSANSWSLSSKLYHLLLNQSHTDLTFTFQEEEDGSPCAPIHAHRLPLIACSPVFEAMLTGPLKERDGGVIKIEDTSREVWSVMLKYIYTSQLPPKPSASLLTGLLHLADKYDLPSLSSLCSGHLKVQLSKDNAVSVFQAAQMVRNNSLFEFAEKWITENIEDLLNFGEEEEPTDFINLTDENLIHFLKKDALDVGELDLFLGVARWSQSHNSSSINEILSCIRFPLITAEDFSLRVVPTGLLPLEMSVAILQFMTVPKEKLHLLKGAFGCGGGGQPSLPFPEKPRNMNQVQVAHFAVRLTDMVYPYVGSMVYYDSFLVDVPITLIYLGFPAPDVDNATYRISFQIMNQATNQTISKVVDRIMVAERRKVMRIPIVEERDQEQEKENNKGTPLLKLEAGVLYKIVYQLNGPDTYYADKRIEHLEVKGKRGKVNFKFIGSSCRLVEVGFRF